MLQAPPPPLLKFRLDIPQTMKKGFENNGKFRQINDFFSKNQ